MRPGHADALAQADAGTRHACDHDWAADDDGECCTTCRARRLTVRLAQAPSDVLEVLVDRGGFLDAPTVLAALEHPDANEIQVRNALALLRDLGLATQTFDERSRPHWCATDDGASAIERARTQRQKGGTDAR